MRRFTQLPQQNQLAAAPKFEVKKSSKRQWLHSLYLRIARMRGKPEYLARGLAAGVFAGCFPLFGLQIVLGVSLSVLVRGHKLLAAAGTWLSNPLTYIPIFLFNYHVGQWLLGAEELSISQDSLLAWDTIVELGAEFALTLLLGSFVVGIVSAITTYFVGVKVIRRWRKRQPKRYLKITEIPPENQTF
ncbi:MAG: DUF2062 domain-containing protein [Microcoleaceae cyanobacterium]